MLFIFLLFLRSLLIPSTLISGQRNCGNTARKRSQNQTLSPSGTNPSLYLLPFSIFFFCVCSSSLCPGPLHCNFQLPFIGVLTTHRSDTFFMLLHVLSATMMHCPSMLFSSALLRVIALSGVTMPSKSLREQQYSAAHSPGFSWLE